MITESDARTMLTASKEAYATGSDQLPAQTIGNGFDRMSTGLNDPSTGFHVEIYKNKQTGELIVSFTGTEGSALDALTDLNVGWTQWSRNGEAVMNFIAENVGAGATVHFTGHSLGGALAQFATVDYRGANPDAPATLTTFNALGGVAALAENRKLSEAAIAEITAGVIVTHFRVRDDLVTRLGDAHVGGNVVELDLRPLAGVALSFLDAHVLSTIEASLSNRRLTDAVPVTVNYLNVTGAQRFSAAISNFASNGSFNEAEALIRLSGALISGIQFAPGPELNELAQAIIDNQFEAGLLTETQYNLLASIDYATLRHAITATGVIPVATASLILGSGLKDFIESQIVPAGEAAVLAARDTVAAVMEVAGSVYEFGRLQRDAAVAATVEAYEASIGGYRDVVSSAAEKWTPLFNAYEQAVAGTANALEKVNAFYGNAIAFMADQFERVAGIAGMGQDAAAAIGSSVIVEGQRALALGLGTASSLLDGLAGRFAVVFGETGAQVLRRLSGATNPVAQFLTQIGTGTDPDGNGIPDAPTFRTAFDVLAAFQAAAATWRSYRGDPLVLDLNGDGIQLVQVASSQANFDLNADGVRERVGWIGPNDGILALDANGDGEIRDIGELFGSETRTGFAELAEQDLVANGGNANGKIDAADSVFANLKIWRDLNGDGNVNFGELKPIADYDIKSISLAFTPFTQPVSNPGTILTELGTYQLNDGTTRAAGDALLQRQTLVGNIYAPIDEASSTQDLPDLRGYGSMANLRHAMTVGPELEQEVRSLLSGTPQQILDGVDSVLYRWAGAQSINPASRGGNIDARRLVALEAYTGTPFRNVQTDRNPTAAAASILNNAWNMVREQYAARFLVFGSWFRQIFPAAAYSPSTDFLVLNQDPRNVGVLLRNMRAAGDLNAETAISLLPMVFRNSESGRNDLLLFDGAGNNNTSSTVTGVAFTDLGAGNDLLTIGAFEGLHYSGLGNDTLTFTNGGSHTVINDGGDDVTQSNADGDFVVYAFDGNNRITLKAGSHIVSTGAGNDSISLGAGTHSVNLGAGTNSLSAGIGAGLTSNITVTAGSGNDTINLGSGNHFILAGDGNNFINSINVTDGETGTVFIQTGVGNDIIGPTLSSIPISNRMQGDITIRSGDGWKQIYLGHGRHDIQLGNNTTLKTNILNLGNGDALILTGNGIQQINAGNGNHNITTGSGNDSISLGTGSHTVNLGAGTNSLSAGFGVGLTGNITVTAGSGNDTINLGSGNHSILAGDGNNFINSINVTDGETGTVFIQTGVGNDIIGPTLSSIPISNRMQGDITIRSGDGWKQIYLGHGRHDIQLGNNTTLNTNILNLGNGDALILTGNGIQQINAGNGNHNITTGSGNDSISLGTGSHTVNLGAGTNSLSAGIGAGLAGNITVTAGSGNDTINLGSGNHSILAGDGNNFINSINVTDGETGTVFIQTGVGNDIIGPTLSSIPISNRMQGDITIRSGDGWKQIYLGHGRHDIQLGNNTTLNTNILNLGNGDALILTGNGIQQINAGNGNHNITTGSGNDSISLGTGSHTVNLGAGTNSLSAGFGVGLTGNITVTAGSGNDTINLGSGNHSILAGDGNNFINSINVTDGETGTVFIQTGVGNDIIGPNPSFGPITNRMQGDITIRSGDGWKQIYLGHGRHDIQLGNNTTLNTNILNLGNGDALILTGNGIQQINAGNGNHNITTGSGNDSISLGMGSHTVNLGAGTNSLSAGFGVGLTGNITVTAGSGNDTINLGSGNHSILAGDGNNFINSINVTDGETGMVFIQTGVGNDIIGPNPSFAPITNRMQGDITIRSGDGWKQIYLGHGRHDIQLGNNTTLNTNILNLGNGDALILTGNGIQQINAGNGNHNITTGSGNDSISLGTGSHTVNLGAGTNSLSAGIGAGLAGNITVTAGSGNDTINLGSGNHSISAGDGNNSINASFAVGQTGTAFIQTGVGNDIIGLSNAVVTNRMQGDITIRSGDGWKQIYLGHGMHDIQLGNNTDISGRSTTIQLGDGNALILTGNGNQTINAGVGNHVITTGAGNDSIILGAGNHTVSLGAGNDAIIAGAGNIVIDGGAGNDTYQGLGAGVDIISDSAGTDTVTFVSGLALSQVSLGVLVDALTIDSSFGQLHLRGFDAQQADASLSIENFAFGPSTFSKAQVLALGFNWNGSAGNDVLLGTSVADRFDGLGGKDVMTGGRGNDRYTFRVGSGQDEVRDIDTTAGNIDVVSFAAGITAASLDVYRTATHIVLKANAQDSIAMLWDPATGAAIERVEFSDGSFWDKAAIESRAGAPVNRGPVLVAPVADQQIVEDSAFSYQVPVDTFSDPGDSITYLATLSDGSALPGWLTFDSATQTLTGTPANANVGAIDVRVTASDSAGAPVSDVFSVTVANTDDAPTGLALSSDMVSENAPEAAVGTLSTTDEDAGDTFTYSILAGWDGSQFAITGNELRVGSVGLDFEAGATREVAIRTTDAAGAYFDRSFAINVMDVAEINYAPEVAVSAATVGLDEAVAVSSLLPTTDADGDATLQYQLYDYADGGGYFRVNGVQQAAGQWFTVSGADLANTQYVGGSIPGDETAAVRVSDGMTEGAQQNVTLISVNGYLGGYSGSDTLAGDAGISVLEGREGNDTLNAGSANSLLSGGEGGDTLAGGAANDLLVGGVGDDTIATGGGHNVIAHNAGDGIDTISSAPEAQNSLSLGGGTGYDTLSLSKTGNDLVLNTGANDAVVLKDWYDGHDNVLELQVILDATSAFDANSQDPMYNQRVQTFNFIELANQFDQALAQSPGLTSWALTNALTLFHLSAADGAALGGDLAYYYGKNGTMSGISIAAAQAVIGALGFGQDAQNLRPFNGLQEGLAKLA